MHVNDMIRRSPRDRWREAAARVPKSKRKEVVDMMKAGKTVGEVGEALRLDNTVVAEIIIEEFEEEEREPDKEVIVCQYRTG